MIEPKAGHLEVLVAEPSGQVGLDVVEVRWLARDVGDVGQRQREQSSDAAAVDAAAGEEPGGGEVARIGHQIAEAGGVQRQRGVLFGWPVVGDRQLVDVAGRQTDRFEQCGQPRRPVFDQVEGHHLRQTQGHIAPDLAPVQVRARDLDVGVLERIDDVAHGTDELQSRQQLLEGEVVGQRLEVLGDQRDQRLDLLGRRHRVDDHPGVHLVAQTAQRRQKLAGPHRQVRQHAYGAAQRRQDRVVAHRRTSSSTTSSTRMSVPDHQVGVHEHIHTARHLHIRPIGPARGTLLAAPHHLDGFLRDAEPVTEHHLQRPAHGLRPAL